MRHCELTECEEAYEPLTLLIAFDGARVRHPRGPGGSERG